MYWTFRQKDKISCIRCIGHLDRKTRSLVLDVLDIWTERQDQEFRFKGHLGMASKKIIFLGNMSPKL